MALLCPDNLSSVCGLEDWMVVINPISGLEQTMFHEQGTQSLGSEDFSNFLSAQMQLQNERVRWAVQKQRNQQVAFLINKASWLMRQKEQDLAQATNKAVVLRDYLSRAEMERDSWQRLAKEKEAMVGDLNERLTNTPEDAQSSNGRRNRNRDKKMAYCKRCNERRSSVLFLPCRHLCSCKSCEPFLASCPVCQSVKEATMEVFFV